MNLDRNNYEELFLLYVDGELNAEQKQMVEAFAAINPDLQEELNMLKETVLLNNDLLFIDKSSLYKTLDNSTINTTNCEEHFLLYVDNELNENSKTEVETFVLQHPSLQNNFTLLKQTKLEAETIVCPDKESLYKEEKERRPIIFMWAKRLAIAAAFLLFAVMAWMFATNNKTTTNEPSVAHVEKSGIEKNVVPTVTLPTNKTLSTGSKEEQDVTEYQPMQTQQSLAGTVTNNNKPAKKIVAKKEVVEQQNIPANTIAKIDNNSSFTAQPQQKQETTIAAVTPNKNEQVSHNASNKLESNNNIINTKIANANTASLAAQPAVYRQLDTDEDDESKVVYIGSLQINKSKLNGLFKKAKKAFNKPREEDGSAKETAITHSRTLR